MYIYEETNWPKFEYNEKVIVSLLASLRHKQGQLIGNMEARGLNLRENALLQNLTDDIVHSSMIEGEILAPDLVRSSIARKLGIEKGFTPSERNIDGIVDIMLDATQNYEKKLTKQRLLAWHACLFPLGYSGLTQIKSGKFRDDAKGPMQVISGRFGRETVHFQAIEAEKLESEIELFLNWYNHEEMDWVLKAAIAHLWFLTLHPFEDGNGRIARAITDMSLAKSEANSLRFYSMSSQILLERNKYYEILEDTQKGSLNIDAWLIWFLQCLEKAIDKGFENIHNNLKIQDFLEKLAQGEINERQYKILEKLLQGFEGKLTSLKYAKINKCSQDTASRDIQSLIEKGILKRSKEGGRSTNYLLA